VVHSGLTVTRSKRSHTPRASNRPQEGDSQPCPFCRTVMFFREPNAQNDQPGWFCTCGYQVFARHAAKLPLKERRRQLVERRARVLRKTMVVRARAARLREHSERLRETRRRGKK